MSGARTLVAAVPQRVWMAVASLVVLASVGVSLVLGAGLSTWSGQVGHSAEPVLPRHGQTVIAPPGSSVIVVPTPATRLPTTHVANPPVATALRVATAPVLPHTAVGAAPAAPAAPSVVARPRLARPNASTTPGQSCTPTVLGVGHGRGHKFGLYKHAARACAPTPQPTLHGKAVAHGKAYGRRSG